MTFQVYDNFLDPEVFKTIAETMQSDNFPWFIAKGVNNDDDGQRQFIHIFYRANLPNSGYFDLLNPLLNKLMSAAIIRVKANLVPKTSQITHHGMHRDQSFKCKVGVFYINTNDGFTEFQTGETVGSVANRLLIFDNDLLHGGTSCTNAHERIVININFMERSTI